jgi:hypothetical protein
MPIMNTIAKTLINTATAPFSYLGGFFNPKKSAPPSGEKEEEDKKESEGGSGDAAQDALAAAIGNEKNYVEYNEHDVEVFFADRNAHYQVRLVSRAIKDAEVHINELYTSLKRNRALMTQSGDDLYRYHCANINVNKAFNAKLDMIEKGELKAENDKEQAAFDEMKEEGKREYNQWNEKFIRPGIQNALLARANIETLIPLINMRGGEAEFKGMEAHPIDVHIESIRGAAAGMASADLAPPPEPEPETDEWTMQEFLTAAIIVVIIALVLKTFIP